MKLYQNGLNWFKMEKIGHEMVLKKSLDKHCPDKHGLDKHGLVKHGLDKHGLAEYNFVNLGLAKHGLAKQGLAKQGLVKQDLVKHVVFLNMYLTWSWKYSTRVLGKTFNLFDCNFTSWS